MLNVVLFQPEVPPNTGNIGRLCHANFVRLHLIEPLGFSLEEKALRRAGLDYWDELDLATWPDWEAFLEQVPDEGRLHLFSTRAKQPYWDVRYGSDDFLVFGPETRGLPASLLERHASRGRMIPQRRGRSLNLATAAGIVLYEAIRQGSQRSPGQVS